MKLLDIGTALVPLVPECYHYEAIKESDRYIVWFETGPGTGTRYADGRLWRQTLIGEVHYFTKAEFDSNFDAIQSTFDNLDELSWELISIDYNAETKYIEYVWKWEMIYG